MAHPIHPQGIALAAALAAALSAAPAHARIDSSLSSCSGAPVVTSGGGGGFTLYTEELSTSNCYLYSSAMAGPGYGSALASARLNTGEWSSGSVGASASTGFQEGVTVRYGAAPPDDLGGVFFTPSISFTGSVSAAAGQNAGVGASLSWYFAGPGGQVQGSLSQSSGGDMQQSGPFGFVKLPEVFAIVGQQFFLAGSASASAGIGKLYLPGQTAQGSAVADFSHTLRWMGIDSLRLVDKAGQTIPMPTDFSIQIIGVDSGMDYALPAALPVPEPGTALLMAAGAAVLGIAGRRRARRCAQGTISTGA